MRFNLTYIFCLIITISSAQNDTIYLNNNNLVLHGHKFNKVDNGIKTGNWIEYNVEDNDLGIVLASGTDSHWHDKVSAVYRPLKKGEFNGQEKILSEKISGEINGEKIYERNIIKIVNKIPPDKYFIIGNGKYRDNHKVGRWRYYHKNHTLKKKIIYKNGKPAKDFIIYRPNMSKLIKVKIINKEECEIIKYSETGEVIERLFKNINEIKELY